MAPNEKRDVHEKVECDLEKSSKISLFEILAKFDVIFRGEGVEIVKIWQGVFRKYNLLSI